MPNNPKKIKKHSEWIEFQTKIVYLYEKLFKSNIKDLAEAFSQNSLKGKELYGREKSMKNWLNGHIKKPNKFDLSLYQIGEYYLDKEALFCKDSFKFWGIERFKHRVDMYLNQTLIKTPTQLLYIYFFSPDEEKILYHTLRKNSQDDNYFILNLHNESKHFYVSEYLKHDDTIYIMCESNFDKRFYIFEEENTIAKVRLLGTEICKDFVSKKPRSSLVLLSSCKLTKEDEMKCRHKLNQSNLLIAKPFPHKLKLEDEFLYQNFNHKIDKLKFDLSLISKKSLKQYFVQHLFTQFENINKNNNTFHISLGDYFIFLAFDWLPKDKKFDIKWVFNLNYSMFWLISEKVTHPILTAHRKLAQMGFDIEYIIILRDDKKELKKTIYRLLEFESLGIKISVTYPYISDNQFLLIDDFSMLMNSSNSMETTISLDEKSIKNFKERYQKIKAKAISLEDFIHSKST